MSNLQFSSMVLLAGEQAAPNLLPVRHFQPRQVFILHSRYTSSIAKANNLKMLLKDANPQLEQIEDYDIGRIKDKVLSLLNKLPSAMVNVTGGTKPMSVGAMEAARQGSAQAFYVRSQEGETRIDLYDFDGTGSPFVSDTLVIQGTINLNDYLVSYFGNEWKECGPSGEGDGLIFEQALYEVFQKSTDDVVSSWRDSSNQVEMDFVIRCNNQIGIIQAKTGNAARSLDGIKQLMTGGEQRYFGTFAKRLLIIDQIWGKNESKLRELCETLKIRLIELPGFSVMKTVSDEDRIKLMDAVYEEVGRPLMNS